MREIIEGLLVVVSGILILVGSVMMFNDNLMDVGLIMGTSGAVLLVTAAIMRYLDEARELNKLSVFKEGR